MPEFPATHVNVDQWVNAAADDSAERTVRRVMRLILLAVAKTPQLKGAMVVKGGVLLALGYGTNRHTKDVDFSTDQTIREQDTKNIVDELNAALYQAANDYDDELLCKVQSHEIRPKREDASFPTLRIKIGYALKGEKQFNRMVQGRPSANTVLVDLSFNETSFFTTSIVFDGEELAAYSLFDQVAEKFRAVVQQTSDHRDRYRRQDVYDLYILISNRYLETLEDKANLLAAIRYKFAAREVPCHPQLIENPDVAERSKRDYHLLQDEIEGQLPDFDTAFGVVKMFFISLPWNSQP